MCRYVFVSSIFICIYLTSCKKINSDTSSTNPAQSNANQSADSDLKAAISKLANTLRNGPSSKSLGLVASDTSTSTDDATNISDLDKISQNAALVNEGVLLQLFNSPAFQDLKHDVREVRNAIQNQNTGLALINSSSTSSTNATTGTTTNTQTSISSLISSDNYYAWISSQSPGGTMQLNVLGIALFISMGVYSAVVSKYFLYPSAKDAWPHRKFYTSIAGMRTVFSLGLSVSYFLIAFLGAEGMSDQTFQDASGALAVIDGVTLTLYSLAGLYETARTKEAPLGSYVDLVMDPNNKGSLKGEAEYKMKKDFYQFLNDKERINQQTGEWIGNQPKGKDPLRGFYKGMTDADKKNARNLLQATAYTPEISNAVKNPYVYYLTVNVPESEWTKKIAMTVGAGPGTKVVDSKTGKVSIQFQKKIISQKSGWNKISAFELAFGIIVTIEGAKTLFDANSTSFALVDTTDPKLQYFQDLLDQFEVLFKISDKMQAASKG